MYKKLKKSAKEVFNVFNTAISPDFEYIFKNFFTEPGYPIIFATKLNQTTLELTTRANSKAGWNIPLQIVDGSGKVQEFWLENAKDKDYFQIDLSDRVLH